METFAEHELGLTKAHRNGSCNESKTDILAGAANTEYGAHMPQDNILKNSVTNA